MRREGGDRPAYVTSDQVAQRSAALAARGLTLPGASRAPAPVAGKFDVVVDRAQALAEMEARGAARREHLSEALIAGRGVNVDEDARARGGAGNVTSTLALDYIESRARGAGK
jgi:hypothetical protein